VVTAGETPRCFGDGALAPTALASLVVADPPLSDDDIRRLAHARLVWNTPLAEGHAEQLLATLEIPGGAMVTDLGCGWGELLLRALLTHPGTTGVGVDISPAAIVRGQHRAHALGLEGRVHFERGQASRWADHADALICIGSTHAWESTEAALDALGRGLRRHGKLLLGQGFWVAEPTLSIRDRFGDLPDLAGLIELCAEHGLRPIHLSVATPAEWDEFEVGWTAGLELAAVERAGTAEAEQLTAFADQRRRDYFRGYRGMLGFAYLVLVRAGGPPRSGH
jgi:hypothetical protein